MNIDTMTLDQIRDYIAECKGWRYSHGKNQTIWVLGDFPNGDGSKVSREHPVPDTHDAAAGAMPDGWRIHRLDNYGVGRLPACAWATHNGTRNVLCAGGVTEKDARFRAAAKAWQKERMAAKDHITLNLSNATPDELEAIKNAPDGMLIPVSGAIVDDYFKRPTNDDFTAYLVQQTWTLPTDTYPESKVYGGTWQDAVLLPKVCRGNIAPFPMESMKGPIRTDYVNPLTDARPSWRPTDVPKAPEVAKPVYNLKEIDVRSRWIYDDLNALLAELGEYRRKYGTEAP